MTSTPPDPQSDRDRRPFDELIAVALALLGIGGILAWSFNQRNANFDLSSLLSPTVAPVPVAPVVAPSPPQPSATTAPSVEPSSSPTLSPVPTAPSTVVVPWVPVAPTPPPPTAVTPSPAPVPAETLSFSDVQPDYWAAPFVLALADKGIIEGFSNKTFQPDKPVTRAEFATMLERAIDQPKSRPAITFKDLPPGYWASNAIAAATQMGFLSGYPDGSFQPNQPIPKVQGLVSAASGLPVTTPANPTRVVQQFQDAPALPNYAVPKVAAATAAGLVVNYPDANQLKPNQTLTRADAAALVYQMLVQSGKAEKLSSPYLVRP